MIVDTLCTWFLSWSRQIITNKKSKINRFSKSILQKESKHSSKVIPDLSATMPAKDRLTETIPTSVQDTTNAMKKVVVVGAGPAGLLTVINLIRRNDTCRAKGASPKYQVTLVDPGTDYGKLDENGLKRYRSWMIGLTAHGLTSIKDIEGLYENYIEDVGVSFTGFIIGIGKSIKHNITLTEEEIRTVGFMVDRNYICGGLARYLNEKYLGQKPHNGTSDIDVKAVSTSIGNDELITHYNTRALFVDPENKCVLVRTKSNDNATLPAGVITPIDYDIILGCDGVRSIVRNAFITNHRDFEFDVQDAFGVGKSVHVTKPKSVPEGCMTMAINHIHNTSAFILPERDNQINLVMVYTLNAPFDEELKSNDPNVVASYMKKHFTLFELDDYDDFAKKWVAAEFITTSMAHCNFYHSMKLNALLLGDAAHATVPKIGQGMNTALADAKALDELLDKYNDNWDEVLPAFSKERVKEGNALTDLSFHTFSLSPRMSMEIIIRQTIRRMLNKVFPEWLIMKEPIGEVTIGMKLSDAYDKVSRLGYLQRSRKINNDIRREYFEKESGMIKENEQKHASTVKNFFMIVSLLFALLVAGKSDIDVKAVPDTIGNDELITHYNTRALFVDPENRCVLVRTKSNDNATLPAGVITPIDYDITHGCDGVRSIVRNAFITNHRGFEFDIQDTFGFGKPVHLRKSKSVPEGCMTMAINHIHNTSAFIFPERGKQLNFAMGNAHNASI